MSGSDADRPAITATAPGRVGIIGNPSDMYGGTVISITTEERAQCVLRPAGRLEIACAGRELSVRSPEDLAAAGDVLDMGRALMRHFGIGPEANLRMELSTDVPVQAGMGGSAALMVAAVGALDAWFGWGMHRWALAETARKVEYRTLGVLCGYQDVHMAVFGGLNLMDCRGKASLEQRDDEPLATVEPLAPHCPDVPLIAAHTGIKHHSGDVHKSPRDRWLEGDRAVIEGYEEIARLARLGKRALLDRDWPRLGALMDNNHRIVADLGGSGPANEALIEAARKAGAYGAKLAGAGGGGTILALADDPGRVRAALFEAGADRLFTPRACEGLVASTGA
jgi:galactokinase/mevalonate kinase-like predicted kinase